MVPQHTYHHLVDCRILLNCFSHSSARQSAPLCVPESLSYVRMYIHILLFNNHICIIEELLPNTLHAARYIHVSVIIIANNWPLHRQSRHYHHLNTSTSPKPNYTRQSTLGGCSVCTYTHTHTHTMTYAVL